MKEFVDFLGGQSPFDALDTADLERLADRIEVEYFTHGTVIVSDGQEALDHFWVVRSGAVEVLDRGRVVDLLGPGDTFGHVSVLSGQPPTLSVRAAEDCLCYRLPDPRGVVEHADRLRFDFYGSAVVRERLTAKEGGLRERAHLPVTRFVRPLVRCEPGDRIREVATRIGDAGQTCALVEFGNDLGIVTDLDFRRRVATGEVGVDEPVYRIARRPARTVPGDTTVATALLEMVEHGLRHLVVLDPGGRPAGVLRVVDLASAELRDPLVVRAAVEAAHSVDELAEACRLLPPTAVELFDSGVPPVRIGGLLAAVLDAALRRLLELDRQLVDTGTPCSWLVLGSLARREPLPTSDIDTAIAWADPEPGKEDEVEARQRTAATAVLDDMERCGLPRCHDGANADTPRFGRSLSGWTSAATGWVRDLSGEGALLLATMLADSRPLNEVALGRTVIDRMLGATRTPQFRRALLEYTLTGRPPIGFVRGLVVEHSGEHRGQLSLKRGGLRPVTSLSRWVAVMTGDTHGTTPQRLRRGAAAGLLTEDEAESLVGAYEHLYGLLLEQEVAAIRAGEPASTYVDPGELDSLTRRHLRESFRAIAHVQDRLGSQWQSRWA
ncbi:MAG TPA: putative nucleotidyltransferase substrate binding domain-containing protein [Kineosporiaceae bacterium]|nr:putative nucleotidyltransferase substrate binding domain-containing protein [Kineosporiaceae bacterium]